MTGAPDPDPRSALTGRPCPICGKPATVAESPFCSRRCADIDLHRWLGGVYAIPASGTDEDEGEAPEPTGPV